MKPRDRVLAALRGESPERIPVGAVTQSATLEQMEVTGAAWPEAHADPGKMADLASGARTLCGFDIVRVPFDQTVEAERFGCAVRSGGRDATPSVMGPPPEAREGPPPLPDPRGGRAGVVAEAVRILKDRFGVSAAVAGGVVGPFTLAAYLVGLRDILVKCLMEPDVVRPYLDRALEFAVAYASELAAAGADLIVIEDMGASLDVTSPPIFRSLAAPYQRRLVEAIPVPVILHICGNNTPILPDLAAVGAAGVSLDAPTDLGKARAAFAGRSILVGAVPPAEVLLEGTPEEVIEVARDHLRKGVQFLAPGCGIPPATPTANLRALVAAVGAEEG
ncbi:MAG: MtaA/CmuA family methyltransferase [Planctomycetes bacterium]|nr:MtaA/CmuA family methyltransferase [Planctomycetota bacterium]